MYYHPCALLSEESIHLIVRTQQLYWWQQGDNFLEAAGWVFFNGFGIFFIITVNLDMELNTFYETIIYSLLYCRYLHIIHYKGGYKN